MTPRPTTRGVPSPADAAAGTGRRDGRGARGVEIAQAAADLREAEAEPLLDGADLPLSGEVRDLVPAAAEYNHLQSPAAERRENANRCRKADPPLRSLNEDISRRSRRRSRGSRRLPRALQRFGVTWAIPTTLKTTTGESKRSHRKADRVSASAPSCGVRKGPKRSPVVGEHLIRLD